MKNPFFLVVVLAITVCTVFYIWAAMLAKQKANDLVSKFKDIDSSLKSSTESRGNENSEVEEVYIISSMKSQLVLLIDSLKESYEISSEDSKQVKQAKGLRFDTRRLLSYIQSYNQLKKSKHGSQMPDTVLYNPVSAKFDERKWYSDYFEGAPKEVSITFLNFLRNQLIKDN